MAHYYLNTLYKSHYLKNSIKAICDISPTPEKDLQECIIVTNQTSIEIFRNTKDSLLSLYSTDLY